MSKVLMLIIDCALPAYGMSVPRPFDASMLFAKTRPKKDILSMYILNQRIKTT